MKYRADKLFNAKKRIWELDFLRGLAILLMVFDHFMYDLSILPWFFTNFYSVMTEGMFNWWNIGYDFFTSGFRTVCHYIFATLFLLITGISCTLTHSNVVRATRLLIFAAILTAATAFADTVANLDALIVFGIIHCMAVSVFVYAAINRIFKDDVFLLAFGAAFIVAGILIPWYNMNFVVLPGGAEGFVTAIKACFGFVRAGSDHFPLFPCCGVVLWGAYIGKKFYPDKKSLLPALDGQWNSFISSVGRHTVWVYMLHQPVVAGIILFFGLINGLEVF